MRVCVCVCMGGEERAVMTSLVALIRAIVYMCVCVCVCVWVGFFFVNRLIYTCVSNEVMKVVYCTFHLHVCIANTRMCCANRL